MRRFVVFVYFCPIMFKRCLVVYDQKQTISINSIWQHQQSRRTSFTKADQLVSLNSIYQLVQPKSNSSVVCIFVTSSLFFVHCPLVSKFAIDIVHKARWNDTTISIQLERVCKKPKACGCNSCNYYLVLHQCVHCCPLTCVHHLLSTKIELRAMTDLPVCR